MVTKATSMALRYYPLQQPPPLTCFLQSSSPKQLLSKWRPKTVWTKIEG